ncbi:hypothetical protein OG474_39785 [Kribbella sp. NBC_01505]|uniref:hypothetical protein n=1 Tax=Kribbella sp. NBC_01505 TaxID=2903580 RepID=UPI003863F2F5
MRVVRVLLGVVLALVGLILTLGGGAAAFWVIGPDDTVQSGEQHLTSKGLGIASAPELLDRHGPILHVEARATNGKPVFVGVARDFDVASYFKNVAHTELVQLSYPIALTPQELKGATDPLAAPAGLDWWVAKASGAGSQSLRWPIADGPYDVVIMSADGKTAPDVQVRFGIEIPNAFTIALVIFIGGLLILALGIVLIVVRRRPTPAVPQPQSQPQPQPQPQAPAGTTAYRVVAGAAVLGLLTGCSVVPERDTITTITRPAIGDEAGQAVLKRYTEVSTAAGSKRDEGQIGQVEGGELVKQTRAAYAIGRKLKRPIPKPAAPAKPVFAAPEYGGYPMRFVSTAGSTVSLWQRASAGSPWLQTHNSTLQKSAKLPDLTGMRPATAADDKDLKLAPEAAVTALSQWLTAEGKSPNGASFAVLPQFDADFKQIAGWRADWKKTPGAVASIGRAYSQAAPPAAFITKSGEAVVLATINQKVRIGGGERRLHLLLGRGRGDHVQPPGHPVQQRSDLHPPRRRGPGHSPQGQGQDPHRGVRPAARRRRRLLVGDLHL